ncbi:MAG: UDP-N-acetylmuramate--L-alanine ligase [Candidatus Poribacteria bacterium]|nr:UDP-N-acetylmuramate--L-alanine ligase [Candidatus Poribacteria bacterium]MDE0505245.1 UDP-N-acetylmuramate--L-alanine ligase [Candidatus Poribacteria bacterium]
MFGKTRHVHIIGIGGAGLSGISEILLSLGFHVSGSDMSRTEITEQLIKLGATVYHGHQDRQVTDADVVVMSPAIPFDNPEILAAKARQIPVIRGAEMLAEIMRMKFSVAVSGTHGKTTTTAMTAAVLDKLDPTVVVGGKLVSLGSHARIGQGEVMVVEADEAYGSLEKFFPTVAVVTSVDADHLDYYNSIEEIGQTFLKFINKVPFFGTSVLCIDQENIQQLLPKVERRYITYGINTRADLMAEKIRVKGPTSWYQVKFRGEVLGELHLKMPGNHNISNSLAAIGVGIELDIPFSHIQGALESFQGIHRRFEIIGNEQDIIVVDDYAHNPAKLQAVFRAVKESYNRRVVAVFQPHRYQRVRHLAEEFSKSFCNTDVLIVTSIYGAGETPIEGVTGENLANAIKARGHRHVIYIPDKGQIVDALMPEIRPNDIVVTVGAGDIWQVGRELLRRLQ